ncbi:hypothetical protein Barb4_01406 [Bacteroidales bacterium Barb4]|nr:hypothetical protein Barb4_01406 [Bacteroidales bacterium Barb4]
MNTKMTKGTFDALDPQADLFTELKKNPEWWKMLKEDKELHIEIRKDNYINAYYNGGSVAKIEYKAKDFVLTTNQKYLGIKDDKDYLRIDLAEFNKDMLKQIKERICKNYNKHIKRWLQDKMIAMDKNYIDSEFQYNQTNGTLHIDLIELKDSALTFIELKQNGENRNPNNLDIIEQFIADNKAAILDYYKKLITLKNELGILSVSNTPVSVNDTPKLIIENT